MLLSSLLSKPCISLLITKPFPDSKNSNFSPTPFTLYSFLKTNGVAFYKSGLIPFAATFLVSSDYLKNSTRLSALSHAGVIYIMTHVLPKEYREHVLPSSVSRHISVEAGSPMGWSEYVGRPGKVMGVEEFGANGAYLDTFKKFGFSEANVTRVAKSLLSQY